MFILPALLYLKVLPLFGQCLYHLIVPNKPLPSHAGRAALSRWSSTGLAPFLGKPGQCGYFYAIPTGERLATTYDLACSMLHTRRIYSGIRFRAWNPPTPKPRPYH
ncbi:hypothetical protein AVEN_221761-1 [Araneus ventricosus]|uniref:Secreted protein n=1 Tax=Araneus ventricosus TaxID=182803 RepID=A0A4Y2FQN6_ARAVE|nr:hypothetical protein AVEN_221761-1 [Araneus ventricosus]